MTATDSDGHLEKEIPFMMKSLSLCFVSPAFVVFHRRPLHRSPHPPLLVLAAGTSSCCKPLESGSFRCRILHTSKSSWLRVCFLHICACYTLFVTQNSGC